MNQHIAIFQNAFHRLLIGYEVRRQVAAVELHAFDPFNFRGEALAFVNGDDAILANLLHGLRKHLADFAIAVAGDGADLGHLFGALDLNGELLEFGGDVFHRLLDALLHLHRVHAGNDRLEAFVENGFGQHRGGGGAIARDVGRLGGHFLDHLGAHVFVSVFQLDLLGDRNAVLGHRGRTERLLQDDVAALGTERNFDSFGKLLNAPTHCVASFLIESDHLGHWWLRLVWGWIGLPRGAAW